MSGPAWIAELALLGEHGRNSFAGVVLPVGSLFPHRNFMA
jgi:hypothetical protein